MHDCPAVSSVRQSDAAIHGVCHGLCRSLPVPRLWSRVGDVKDRRLLREAHHAVAKAKKGAEEEVGGVQRKVAATTGERPGAAQGDVSRPAKARAIRNTQMTTSRNAICGRRLLSRSSPARWPGKAPPGPRLFAGDREAGMSLPPGANGTRPSSSVQWLWGGVGCLLMRCRSDERGLEQPESKPAWRYSGDEATVNRKSQKIRKLSGGVDGTRTRGLRRDRPAF
jgi:hypothetical protein